ncbi:SDR family oxidoreductase [Synechococcus sp. UW105]|uniref:SDR family oxidoreductase n=1 Tax=Synechococcus sp. UW105 TaxID=337067 RepID=UPI001FCC712A|nr:SDR family oxidoreductase [Synechococcus sp. UW105]
MVGKLSPNPSPIQAMLKPFDLRGKTALITGAAGLLGMQHAAALLECGACVILTDVSHNALDQALYKLRLEFPQAKILSFLMDVTSIDSIISVQQKVEGLTLTINILVNNAAIDPKVKANDLIENTSRFEYFPREQWDSQIAVGLTGSFLCSQIFGHQMALSPDDGVILNIASDLSIIAPDQRLYQQSDVEEQRQAVKPVTYSVIKTGLIGLTRYLATYWADKGVRCNALSPGGVFTDQNKEFVTRLSSLIPLGRMAHNSEYRSAIQFLCSDASSYMNGHNMIMDGGRSVW